MIKRIVCISDTHEQHDRIFVPVGDLLIFAGDMSLMGEEKEIRRFNNWLGYLPHPHKVVIAGNHDWMFEKRPAEAEALITNATYLNDSGCVIEGLKIWGSPVQPEFCNWAFNRRRGLEIDRHWRMIPDDADILVTHGPPYGVLDTSHPGGHHLGCTDLMKAVDRVNPKLHVFGHIHGGAGWATLRCGEGPLFVNAAVLNEAYQPNGQEFVVEWPVADRSSLVTRPEGR